MQTLDVLERRIGLARELRSVVRTMKTMAAVSIRQYEEAVSALAGSVAVLELGARMVRFRRPDLWERGPGRPPGGVGAVVFGSDRALCGRFNDQIVAFALDALRQEGSAALPPFLVAGARCVGPLEEAGATIDGVLEMPASVGGITGLAQDLLHRIDAWRRRRTLGTVVLFHQRRLREMAWEPAQVPLLPPEPGSLAGPPPRTWPGRTLPSFTMEPAALVRSLVREQLFLVVYRACAESLASENASRIRSMQAAERNLGERLEELQREYHELRQTAITEELLDVVTGFEALETDGAS